MIPIIFLRGRPRRRFAGATDEPDCGGFEDRGLGVRRFFCSFSSSAIKTSSSSVMFNPVVLVNRFPRGGFVCVRSFSSSRVRFAINVLITLRTATMGSDGDCGVSRSENDFRRIQNEGDLPVVLTSPSDLRDIRGLPEDFRFLTLGLNVRSRGQACDISHNDESMTS